MPRMNKLSSYKTHWSVDGEGNGSVYYHSTEIVQWSHKSIILRSGGYQSVTTKRKMNQASNQFNLGYGVYQKDYNWYVTWKGQTLEFTDGMVLR